MNSRQLQYAVLLSEMRNFSLVAERLHISQPALSKQIINLEQELGVKLFDRSKSPLELTPAGEFFVQHAKNLLYEEDQLVKTMDRYKTGENGRLIIGVSPFRSLYLMPDIVLGVKQRFPGVQVVLAEAGSAQLHKGMAEAQYDFAIMNLPIDEAQLEAVPLEPDELVLAVPRAMLHLMDGEPTGPVDLAGCSRLPFVALSRGQELRQLLDNLCAMSDLRPEISVEVVSIAVAWAMVRAGAAATLLPRQFVRHNEDASVALFALRQKAYVRQPAIVTRRGQYISPYAAWAMELLKTQSAANT